MPAEALFNIIDIDSQPDLTDLHAFNRYWHDIRGDTKRVGPSWQDVDLLQLPTEIVPRVCVLDVIPEGPDFQYRFWGTAITDMHHYDLTGKSVLNLTPEHYAKCIWRQYAAVLENRKPLSFLTEVPLDDGRMTYYAASRLPLSSDGENINMIISAEEYGKDRHQLAELFKSVARLR